MPILHQPAICLRRYDYSETSQVVHLLTRESGVLHLLAKGSRRLKGTFDGGLDLLDRGTASFTLARDSLGSGAGKTTYGEGGPPMGLLTAWYQEEGHRGLHRSLVAQRAGLYAAEVVAALVTEHQAEAEIFDALAALLAGLDLIGLKADERYPQAHADFAVGLVLAFQIAVLSATGYSPLLDRCVGTQMPLRADEPAWFSPVAGGLLSRDAEGVYADKVRVSAAVRGAMQGQPAAPGAQRTAVSLLSEHLEQVAERRFKAYAALRKDLGL